MQKMGPGEASKCGTCRRPLFQRSAKARPDASHPPSPSCTATKVVPSSPVWFEIISIATPARVILSLV